MVTIAGSRNPISEIWARLIVTAVWQSTLLAIFIALLTSRLKQASPVIRYWLWQSVALKLLIGPFWTVLIPLPAFFPRDTPVPAPAPLPSPVADALAERPDPRVVRRTAEMKKGIVVSCMKNRLLDLVLPPSFASEPAR